MRLGQLPAQGTKRGANNANLHNKNVGHSLEILHRAPETIDPPLQLCF